MSMCFTLPKPTRVLIARAALESKWRTRLQGNRTPRKSETTPRPSVAAEQAAYSSASAELVATTDWVRLYASNVTPL